MWWWFLLWWLSRSPSRHRRTEPEPKPVPVAPQAPPRPLTRPQRFVMTVVPGLAMAGLMVLTALLNRGDLSLALWMIPATLVSFVCLELGAVAVRDHQAEASNELADRTEALNEKLKDETKEKD
jgi:hypothetical protein